MTDLTPVLKQELWRRFGRPEYPAEWNGIVYGGGKVSQRFWEYFIGVQMLRLCPGAVVLDIGGGSPVTGGAFFTELIAGFVKHVIVLDPYAVASPNHVNVVPIARPATYAEIQRVLATHPDVTHVCSLSVFEHIDAAVREEIIRGVNDHFTGRTFVATLEYHSKKVFFEQQLTAQSLSSLFTGFTNFYLDEIQASPVWAEDAFSEDGRPLLRPLRRIARKIVGEDAPVPRWYPVALRFERVRPRSGEVVP